MLDSMWNYEAIVAEVKTSRAVCKHFAMAPEVIYTGLASTISVGSCKQTGAKVAVKVVVKSCLTSDEELVDAAAELAIHKALAPHPNVVRLLCSEETELAFILVTPYSPKLDLWQLVRYGKTYAEVEVQRCAGQMLSALAHIHDVCDVIHSDIKPQNFLLFLVDGKHVVQLCDFGLALHPDLPNRLASYRGLRGTSGWFAPEVLAEEDYGFAVDIFGIGLIIFRMLAGYAPFEPPSNFSTAVEFDDRYWGHISSACQEWLSTALDFEPKLRGTARKLQSHDWHQKAVVEPTPEQLERMSRYGPAPDKDVLFWPADAMPSLDGPPGGANKEMN